MSFVTSKSLAPWVRQSITPILDGMYTAWGRDTRLAFAFTNVPNFYVGTGTEFFVAKTGDDTTGNGSAGSPWLTIDFALQQITAAGQTITVSAGTYQEAGNYTIQDTYKAALKTTMSGTLAEPITIRAKAGDEDLVIIDGQNLKAGLLIGSEDYIQIFGLRFINNYLCAVAIYDTNSPVLSIANKSVGVRLENSYFGNAIQPSSGVNTSCLRLFATQDLIIRDCTMEATELTCNGYQSYSQTNTLVENCYINVSNNGIYFKDHFIEDLITRKVTIGAEIRYNRIRTDTYALQIGIQGTGTQEAGYTYYHHNISSGHTRSSEFAVVKANMGGAFGQSTKLRVENNIADMTGATSAYFIESSSMDNIQVSGNIAVGMKQVFNLIGSTTSKATRLTISDYNIYNFLNTFATLDRYSLTAKSYITLADWQAAKAEDTETLMITNPDQNTIESTAAVLFNDVALDDYTHKAGSPSIGFLSNGTNAGAYQAGIEVIGRLNGQVIIKNKLQTQSGLSLGLSLGF